jgi:hypothetical protein
MSVETVECEEHGKQKVAFICQHVVATLEDGQARGFVWDRDEDGLINAYCDDCDAAIEANNGDWTPEIEAKADVGMMCEVCVSEAAKINGEDTGA